MGKRLVVCDGAWNFADQPSKINLAKIALSVRPESAVGREQRVYYHSGVGTLRQERLRGGAFGMGLSRNWRGSYATTRHLVPQDLPPGDPPIRFIGV